MHGRRSVSPGTVTFVCRNCDTRWGQEVCVAGGIAELGGWEPAAAVKLSADSYPVWRAAIAVPENVSFEWTCLKKQGPEVVWQAGENNHYPGSGRTASGSF